MLHRAKLLLACTLSLLIFPFTQVAGQSVNDLNWILGPNQGSISSKATIEVPDGYAFLNSTETKKYMRMLENIPGENQYTFAPIDLSWFAVFEFDPVGYVKDDEVLDPNSLLDTVRKGTERGNVEKRKRGWQTLSIIGWEFQPRYDRQNNLLEWAFLAQVDNTNETIINYNTRVLGRSGVMNAVLVADPNSLDNSVYSFKNSLNGFRFVSGESYKEFRQGDRIAEFGLAALVVGGAGAAATKKGFGAAVVVFLLAAKKFAGVAIIGIFAWIVSLFRRKN